MDEVLHEIAQQAFLYNIYNKWLHACFPSVKCFAETGHKFNCPCQSYIGNVPFQKLNWRYPTKDLEVGLC